MSAERILCAAIYVDNGSEHPPRRSHGYPKTGLVFAGWRHSDCFTSMLAWADMLDEWEKEQIAERGEHQLRGKNQGFLTSTGRYVDRVEGMRVAIAAGQVREARHDARDLFSEDLY